MLQSLVARFAACIKALSQSFLLPRDSPVWATLWLQISCLYAFPHVLPSAWSFLFLHVKKKLVSRSTPISFNSLGFLNFTFYSCPIPPLFFLFQGHEALANTWFVGYCLGAVDHHHLIALNMAVPDCSYVSVTSSGLCYMSPKPMWGRGSGTAPEALEILCQNESKLCFNTQTLLPNSA